MAGFLKVARAEDVPAGQRKMVEVAGKNIAIFNLDGDYYAIDDTCTHRGGPLSGREVTCPWHGAIFDVTTGEMLGPPAPKGVSRYSVRIADGDIEIEI